MKLISRNLLKGKLFLKLYVTNFLIVLIMVVILLATYSRSIDRDIQQQETYISEEAATKINQHLAHKAAVGVEMLQQIFYNWSSSESFYPLISEQNDGLNYESETMKINLTKFLQRLMTLDPDIRNIIFYSKVNQAVFSYSKSGSELHDANYFQKEAWYKNVNDDLYGVMITPSYIPPYQEAIKDRVFSLVTNVKSPDLTKNAGVLIINFSSEGIQSAYADIRSGLIGIMKVALPNSQLLYDSTGAYQLGALSEPDVLNTKKTIIQKSNQSNLIITPYVDADIDNFYRSPDLNRPYMGDFQFILTNEVPRERVAGQTNREKRNIYVIVDCFFAAFMMINTFTLSTLSKKVKKIILAIRKTREANFKYRIPVRLQEDEIGSIGVHFNEMCERLEEYINQVYVAEIKQKQAELVALQAQINPHFLYNTLQAIHLKAITDGNEAVGQMVYNLSLLLRNLIKGDRLVTIREEIRYSKLYLDLFEIRYGENLQVEYRIDPAIMNYKVPKLILQPLLENCILHAFDLNERNNRITIEGELEGPFMTICISDNGIGMDEDRLASIRKQIVSSEQGAGTSIGLFNVDERIKLQYGQEYGLQLGSRPNQGTVLILTFPAPPSEELKENV